MKLKFRIFDIETNRFFYWNIYETPPIWLTNDYIENHAEQFIGRYDKHGREIYIGDFVNHKNGECSLPGNDEIEIVGNVHQNNLNKLY